MSGRRLYVGRLDQNATRKDIEDYFGTHGPIVDVRLMAGFCFLEFQELKDAEQAVNDFSGKEFMNQRLIVEFAKPPRNVDPDREPRRDFGGDRGGDRGYGRPSFDRGGGGYGDRNGGGGGGMRGGGGHRLVVNGVPDGCSWQDLKDFARSAGTVTFADVDRNNPSVGYIEYPSRADADEAIRTLSSVVLKGANVSVEDMPAGGMPSNGGGGGGGYGGDRGGDRGYDRRDDRRGGDYGRDSRDSRDYGRDSRDSRDYGRRDDRDDRRGDDRDRRGGGGGGDYGRRDERRRSVSPRRERRSPPPRERSPQRERERSPPRERSPAPAGGAAPADNSW